MSRQVRRGKSRKGRKKHKQTEVKRPGGGSIIMGGKLKRNIMIDFFAEGVEFYRETEVLGEDGEPIVKETTIEERAKYLLQSTRIPMSSKMARYLAINKNSAKRFAFVVAGGSIEPEEVNDFKMDGIREAMKDSVNQEDSAEKDSAEEQTPVTEETPAPEATP